MDHSKLCIQDYKTSKSKELLKMNKTQIRVLTSFLTGHCRLKYHLGQIGISENTTCRLCELEDETAKHILSECPALENRRRQIFGIIGGDLEITELVNYNLKTIYRFLEGISIIKKEYLHRE